MQPLESALDKLVKKLPQLPENAKKGLATAMPWLALVGGLLGLWGVWNLYQVVTWVTQWTGYTNSLYNSIGYAAPTATGYGVFVWVSLALLAVQAVLMLVAFPALKAHKKSGWNILLWSAYANIVYDVIYCLFGMGYVNVGQLIGYLIGAAIGLYLLFEVRAYFTGVAAPAAAKPAAPAAPSADKKA